MNKIENYLGVANHDIQMANNSQELKSYVASILYENDELQQENKKYKEVIEKIKTRYCDYYGTTKEINDDYVLRNVLKEISDILKEVK